jgi:polyphenol oxidase
VRVPPPFERVGDHIAIELPGARALFTTRHGGVSGGPYASLNLGRLTDDDPAAVERNRTLLAGQLGVGFAYGRQVHGAVVSRVKRAQLGTEDPAEADGQATDVPGVAPLALTADCLPIALAAKGVVAMVHAGWRGLEAGVIAEGMRAVRGLGGQGPIEAAIGPGAGACCYEVGEEVHARFEAIGPLARRETNLDLKAIARTQLEAAGAVQVHDVKLCTMCCDDFYSHRRDGGVTGRQAGIAWLS